MMSRVYLHRDDAIKFIKKSYKPGVSHFVRGGTMLYTEVPGEDNNARGYDLTCLIKVSQKAALKYITDMMADAFVEKGVKICIAVSEPDPDLGISRCDIIFIG